VYFFSFHYKRDVWRANQVRHSWVTKGVQEAGYIDAADFEQIERRGEQAVHQWIDAQLNGTSVTVVLIGAETASREYVQYEIEQSVIKGNGLIGIYIHQVKNKEGQTDFRGNNPIANLTVGGKTGWERAYRTYDWVNDEGRSNFGDWVEAAARQVGR
jgi:hypothetical protein